MKRSYYFFNPGRLSRKDNTIELTIHTDDPNEKSKRIFLPIEEVDDLFIFGSLDANSALFTYLGKYGIPVHFFDFYENYKGSFVPKEYLLSGKVLVKQVEHYSDPQKRIQIARKIIHTAAFNIVRNLKYYNNREKDLKKEIEEIETLSNKILSTTSVPELMGIEGNIRQIYYSAFPKIVEGFAMELRTKQPPRDELNAMISYGNSLCYAACVRGIYHTQLNSTISYLHEPGERRYSLSLDIAEIFKPVITDRLIFRLLNKKEITKKDFIADTNGCFLKESGRRTFTEAFEERMKETIESRELKKKVSYKYLIQLECYKLIKHILGIREYKPFKMNW